jgi:hypothetical protein
MKRLGWILVLLLAASPAWAAKKITVQQLKDLLISWQQANKTDAAVADYLRNVRLSEQMTSGVKISLVKYAPGPFSVEQIEILEGLCAFLPPPASDLPSTPAPDAAMQNAILAKAQNYVTSIYIQNPHLTATKQSFRYQDDVGNMSTTPGIDDSAPNIAIRMRDINTDTIESDQGIEKTPNKKERTQRTGLISDGGPGPSLGVVLQEATAAGKLAWLRWETVDGRPAAVFSFAVEKKKSRVEVNFCCFPHTETETDIAGLGGGPLPGNVQSLTELRPFRKSVGYHGEIFIDPEKGNVRRLIFSADLKPTDFVHQQDIRTDYGTVFGASRNYSLPINSFILTEVVPNGDSNGARYFARHALFKVTYQNYQPAGTPQK